MGEESTSVAGSLSSTSIEAIIDKKIGEVRTEVLDLSFGEIVNLYSNGELIIQPEYQRLFRWSPEQRSRIIESLLLELPIPQIFVIENEDGVIELIDGLQRVSSVIQFMESGAIGLEPLELRGCDLITALNGNKFTDLSMKLRLRLKRSSVRTVVIKRQSSSFLRYEMFKRLNTGGAILASQEVRNCTARMLGDRGIAFYKLLQECAGTESYLRTIETLALAEREQKGDEELVLRFFALKNAQDMFKGSVRDWLDDYMEAVLLNRVEFDIEAEKKQFESVFNLLGEQAGAGAFVRYRDNQPVGGLAPAYFESVTLATVRTGLVSATLTHGAVLAAIKNVVQSAEFRHVTGPGANSKEKLETRVRLMQEAFEKSKA